MKKKVKQQRKKLIFQGKTDEKIWLKSLFLGSFFTPESLKWHPEVPETWGKFPKCALNIYLAIPKSYDIIKLVEKKL